MKESVTKFDLEAAFKALDEIDIPIPERGVRANRVNLAETFENKRNHKLKTEILLEDYYDVNNVDDLSSAKTERDAEVAKAKLARIEKIVDLDAKSPEDLQQSYVGKYILQCPNCMTLFYKDEADVTAGEDDGQPLTIGDTVNIGEECQHCRNKDGYTLQGKVGVVEPEEAANYEAAEEATAEASTEEEIGADETTEVAAEEAAAVEEEPTTEEEIATEESTTEEEVSDGEGEEVNLEAIPNEEVEEEEQKEESFNIPSGTPLAETFGALSEAGDIKSKIDAAFANWDPVVAWDPEMEEALVNKNAEQYPDHLTTENRSINEAVDTDLNKKLADYNEFIEFTQKEINDKEAALAKATNTFIKEAIQAEIDDLKAKLEAAIPEQVKAQNETEELPEPEEVGIDADSTGEEPSTKATNESLNKSKFIAKHKPIEVAKKSLNEDTEEAAFNELLQTEEFKEPITDNEVQEILADAKIDEVEDIVDESLNTHISNFLTEVYSNVDNFEATSCELTESKLIIEGNINFKSGKSKNTKFEFQRDGKQLKGINEAFSDNAAFTLNYSIKNKEMIVESLDYSFIINKNIVKGSTKN